MDYLRIRNWGKWQSWRSDRGQPPWIKLHRCVMRNFEWMSLTDAQRGQLVAIWLLAADRDGVIPASPRIIQKLCNLDSEPDLQLLTELGFIEHDANLTPERRQSDADLTNKNRIDQIRIDKNRVDQDPPKAPPLGGDSISAKQVRKRRTKSEPVRLTDQQQVWFGLFWAKYPRGDGKQNAAEAWAKGKLGETELDAILVALSWQIPDWEEKHQRNGYDPPHAATYLNQRRWEDKPPVNVGPKPEPVRTEQLDSSNEFIRRCAEMARRFPSMSKSDIAEKVEMEMAEAEQVRKAAAAKRRNGTEQPVAVANMVNQVTEQMGAEP